MNTPIELIIPAGHKLCRDCLQIKPACEFTGNICYTCIKPKRDEKYFRRRVREAELMQLNHYGH